MTTRSLTLATLASILFVTAARAETIGVADPAAFVAANTGSLTVDTAAGYNFFYSGGAFTNHGTAVSVNFDATSDAVGHQLEIMIGNGSGSGFTPTGIFEPITVTGGDQIASLVLDPTIVGNSAHVSAGETFAWRDGSQSSANTGSIYFIGGGDNSASYTNQNIPALGVLLGLGGGGREYAINVTTVPEPSTLVLCGLGTIGLLLTARRRRQS